MNTCFFDQNKPSSCKQYPEGKFAFAENKKNLTFECSSKKVVIKILSNPNKVEREIYGSLALGAFVQTPTITHVDTKTIIMSYEDGICSKKYDKQELNNLIIQFFQKIWINKPLEKTDFSIVNDIKKLIVFFKDDQIKINQLKAMLKQIKNCRFVPVHGDLQKQNILVHEDNLCVIDFEHFTYAPIELEIVNSLFFRDSNCLDIQKIIPFCIETGMMKQEILESMLLYYSLRQEFLGRNKKEVQKKLSRGLLVLHEIIESMTLLNPRNSRYNWAVSSCFM